MRAGIVGCGFIANAHSWSMWALRTSGAFDVRVTAVCDSEPEKAKALAAPLGAEVMGFDDLVDAVDVVWICTHTASHLELVERAVAKGKPVFCEKPLAPDLATAQRVADALRGVPHQVGLVLRNSPVFVAMTEAIASGTYGAPMAATLRDDQFFPITGHYASTWRSDVALAGGGTLIEHSIHDIDLFAMLFGPATDVTCRTNSRFGYAGIEDVAVASIGYEAGGAGGVVANLVSVWHNVMSRPSTRRLEVFCEDAMLWCDDDNLGPLHIHTSAGEETIELSTPAWTSALEVPEPVRASLGMYGEATRSFLQAVTDGASGFPDATVALDAHRVVDACYRSAATGAAPIKL